METSSHDVAVLDAWDSLYAADHMQMLAKHTSDTDARDKAREPLFCASVTFSRAGNSTISMPTTVRNCVCASLNTLLNCLGPQIPNTFSLISCRRMGLRWYSQASARRTIFATICSWLSSWNCCVSEAYASSSGVVRPGWVAGSGDVSGESSVASSSSAPCNFVSFEAV